VPGPLAHARRAGLAGALTLLALGAPAATAGAQSPAAERATDLAMRGLGGERALRDLGAFRLEARGRTFVFDDGPVPGDAVIPAGTFRLALDYDLRGTHDRLRADYVRTSLGVDREVSEVVVGRRGFISGLDANFQPPSDKPMTSDRWGAVTREQRLLNPLLYVHGLLTRRGAAAALPSQRLRGRLHRVLAVRGDVAPVRLHLDPRTGRISRLTTTEHNYNRGDVQTVVDYRGWRDGGGVWFPRTVTLRQEGRVLHQETRTEIGIDQPLANARFRFPSGVRATYDAELAVRGAITAAWLMGFAHFGFVKDGAADVISPRVVASGSTLIQGHANQSMIVEQQDGIVVVEGALNDYRAEALIGYVERTFPGRPIRYVTVSHHHADHAGGMRPFVALGARPVVHTASVDFFEDVFAVRGSRLLPDRLDRSDARADILAVPATGTVTLEDPVRPVVLLAEPTQHATTTILHFVPSEGVLFVNGDTYTPGTPPGPGARTLDETIRANGLAVQWIVGGHGGVVSYADFQQALAQP
jgi:glyoxylase-like metal-dependent hydrolase (beta-lactamase superfamily II)